MTHTASLHPSNNVAVNLFRAWLRAVGIPFRDSSTPDADFTLTATSGESLTVCVGREHVPDGALSVPRKAMTGKRISAALEAFWAVTDAAGYPRRRPVDRGPELAPNKHGNPRKLHYRHEPFLVSVRHTELRSAPDPTPEQWALYEPVARRVAGTYWRNYRNALSRNGHDFEDVLAHTRCLTINFCARHEVPDDPRNPYRLKCYLLQRLFTDAAKVLLKKERSVLPDAETANICVYGRPEGEEGTEPEIEVVEFESSEARLERRLSALPHTDLVKGLRQAALRRDLGAAAKLAATRLQEHLDKCKVCKKKRGAECVPQVNQLSRVRSLVEAVEAGVRGAHELAVACRFTGKDGGRRQVAYHRQAAQALAMLDETGEALSPRGRTLLATRVGSVEERRVWMAAIVAHLPDYVWVFEAEVATRKEESAIRQRLSKQLQDLHGLTEETAYRRASGMMAWRGSVSNDAGVQEHGQVAGADALGVQE